MNKAICFIVVGIDQKHVRHGFESPLQPAVQIKIFDLGVVLKKGGPKEIA